MNMSTALIIRAREICRLQTRQGQDSGPGRHQQILDVKDVLNLVEENSYGSTRQIYRQVDVLNRIFYRTLHGNQFYPYLIQKVHTCITT